MIGIGLSDNIAPYLLLQAINWENERVEALLKNGEDTMSKNLAACKNYGAWQ